MPKTEEFGNVYRTQIKWLEDLRTEKDILNKYFENNCFGEGHIWA